MHVTRHVVFVGVKNGHDEVNIQISIKISMNIFKEK